MIYIYLYTCILVELTVRYFFILVFLWGFLFLTIRCPSASTGPEGSVVKSSDNGLVGTVFASRVFKGPVGRC